MVPNGWSQLKGKEITAKITKGSSPKWQGFDYQKEGTLFVTSENVRDGFLDISSPKYLPLEFNQKLKNSQLEKGDILINIVGASIGRSCQFDIENQSANINQAVCLFRTNELVKSEFIFQFLQHSTTINKLLGTQSESARPNLSLSDMRDFVFSIPPLPEQRKIAKILSTWDKAISTTERLIDNSKQQKKALMQQLLTGAHTQRKRLLDDSGKPFEGEWSKVELGKLLDYKQPTPYLVKSTDYSDEYSTPVLTAGKTFILGYSNEDFGIFEEELPAIIFDDFTTASKFVDFPFKAKSSAMKILVAKQGVSIKFVYESMQVMNYPVGGHQRHWISIFANLVIGLPSLLEQEKIASVLTNADQEIELLEQQLADLKQEKKALMQQLLTGKCRVKVDDKEVA